MEFKSIFHPVSIQEEHNDQAEIISIYEVQNHLTGNSFSIQKEGLATETNTTEVSSLLGEDHHHQHCQEETENQAEQSGKQDEARDDSDNMVEEPAG